MTIMANAIFISCFIFLSSLPFTLSPGPLLYQHIPGDVNVLQRTFAQEIPELAAHLLLEPLAGIGYPDQFRSFFLGRHVNDLADLHLPILRQGHLRLELEGYVALQEPVTALGVFEVDAEIGEDGLADHRNRGGGLALLLSGDPRRFLLLGKNVDD